mmetsp:Transcript_31298/g.101102  ORF Transcript_31298/g.101102 Transcript_31298/m.101102 type:complete len:393 (+) Transcript_31298:96-1274(+)|eukprot:scaffold11535_cov135-Isochrysis_galbana.AAC.4
MLQLRRPVPSCIRRKLWRGRSHRGTLGVHLGDVRVARAQVLEAVHLERLDRRLAGGPAPLAQLRPRQQEIVTRVHRVDRNRVVGHSLRAEAALLSAAELPAIVHHIPSPVARRERREGRDVHEEAKGRVLTLDPIGRAEPRRRVTCEVYHEARAGHPLDHVVGETPEEPGRVRERPDRPHPAAAQRRALHLAGAVRLQGSEPIATRLEVIDRIRAPERVAKIGGSRQQCGLAQVGLEPHRVDPRVPVRLEEELGLSVYHHHLLEPGHKLLPGTLGVASVRVARRLAGVDKRHVAVGTVLLVKALHDGWLMTVSLVRQQANDELSANRHADVAVLWIPEIAQQSTAVAIALVDPDGKPNDRKICPSVSASTARDGLSSARQLGGRCSIAAGAV